MAKDSGGHGSDGRGGSAIVARTGSSARGIIPTKPFRESPNHQLDIANQHGIPTSHFGQRQAFMGKYGATGGTMKSRSPDSAGRTGPAKALAARFNGGHFASGLGKFKP